jgi:hypothetical protein
MFTTALAPMVRGRLRGPLWVTGGVETGFTWAGFETEEVNGETLPFGTNMSGTPPMAAFGLYCSLRVGLAWGY